MFALVDCNNFYASCERLFRPDLRNKPIAVLSNNDGCAIARSEEAKALGIPMGAPAFKIRHLKAHGLITMSCNFPLYADLSNRVMQTLKDESPDVSVYSIDEAFINLKKIKDPLNFALSIKKIVERNTGISISIGIGPTKTLSKAANRYAKKNKNKTNHVYVVDKNCTHLLNTMDTQDIWGIAQGLGKRLALCNIFTATDLSRMEPYEARKLGGVGLERIVRELKGISCLSFDETPSGTKSIMVSRTFGRLQTHFEGLSQSISMFAARVSEKARSKRREGQYVTIFLRTNKHRKQDRQYHASLSTSLKHPSADTRDIGHAALHLLKKIYKPGFNYSKAGVLLTALTPKEGRQFNLLSQPRIKSDELMDAIDKINFINGKETIRFAASGVHRKWKMNQNNLSPAYTTRWSDLPKVLIK